MVHFTLALFETDTLDTTGRNRTVQVVRKQFPLRPAAAKTIHRSQGDTETRIAVNFETKRAIPHIHYVSLSRVTAIEGLHITNLCEDKISVSPGVKKEMLRLRGEGKLNLCLSPIYTAPESSIKLSFLNARSLHKHINDVLADINYLSTDTSVFWKQDSMILIVILCIKLKNTFYFEMMQLHSTMKDHMVELQCILVLITILDIHTAAIKMT